MPYPGAIPLNVSEQQQEVLQQLVHRATGQELQTHLLAFIAYYNRTSNGPFHWMYKGPPTSL